MKKLTLISAFVLMAGAAFGQNGSPLYITGSGDFAGGEWNPSSPSEFEYNADDNLYTLEISNLDCFRISTKKASDSADWNEFNSAAYDCGQDGYGNTPGVARTLYPNSNALIICSPWTGDYKITVAGDLSWIMLNTDSSVQPPKLPSQLYLFGDMSDWTFEEGWEMEIVDIDHNIYRFICADDQLVSTTDSFDIRDEHHTTVIGGDGVPFKLDEDNQVWRNSNQAYIQLEENWEGVAWLKIDDSLLEGTVVFSNDKSFVPSWYSGLGEIGIDADSTPRYYTLQGVNVKNPKNGVYIKVNGAKAKKVKF